jgi:hypothetical protein
MRTVYKIWFGKSKGIRPLGIPRRGWENIRIDLTEIGWKSWTGVIWIRTQTDEHGNEHLGS